MRCQSLMNSTRSCVQIHRIFDQNSHQCSWNPLCCFRYCMNKPRRIMRKNCHLMNHHPVRKKPVGNLGDLDRSLDQTDNLNDLFWENHMHLWSWILTTIYSLVFLDHEVPSSFLLTLEPVENTYGNILQVFK